MEKLTRILKQIDGKSYKEYHDIKGHYALRNMDLHIIWVQGDPFATPSFVAVTIPARAAKLPGAVLTTADRRVAVADFILRRMASEARAASRPIGTGKGGIIVVDTPSQKILARSAAEVSAQGDVTLRFQVGLPAEGRRILGRDAHTLLTQTLPTAAERAALSLNLVADALTAHAHTYEDQQALRAQLSDRHLVAFIANGSILPRRSGDKDTPLVQDAVPFSVPPELSVTLKTPNAGLVHGLGIREGITVICGGGFHGKSTLLDALSHGIYNHIPGDGRERVVTQDRAVKVRAEDGRAVCCVDISAFIGELPDGRSTQTFTSRNASGSSSQAAAVMESLELGATTLLMDEDTCATNFMLRDRRMQALVTREPITPLIDHIRAMSRPNPSPDASPAVSFVIAMGGSGAYLDLADQVLLLDRYLPSDVTAQAHLIAERFPTGREVTSTTAPPAPISRVPQPDSVNAAKGKRESFSAAPRLDELVLGRTALDLHALEQIVDLSQTRAIGEAILWALESDLFNGRQTLRQLADALDHHQRENGPVFGSPQPDLACVRGLDIAAALNRLRSLQVKQRKAL